MRKLQRVHPTQLLPGVVCYRFTVEPNTDYWLIQPGDSGCCLPWPREPRFEEPSRVTAPADPRFKLKMTPWKPGLYKLGAPWRVDGLDD